MNDAEAGPGSGPRPSRVAFFQVVLTEPSQGRLLPVQPLLSCGGDVVERLGRLRLEAVQVLLPERDAVADGDRPRHRAWGLQVPCWMLSTGLPTAVRICGRGRE